MKEDLPFSKPDALISRCKKANSISGGMIPSFYQYENLFMQRIFLPHPLDCGLFYISTFKDFSSKKAIYFTRRRKEGYRLYKGEFLRRLRKRSLRRLRKRSLGEESLFLCEQEITKELFFFLP